MDRTGPNTGDQNGGTDEGIGGGDTAKLATDQRLGFNMMRWMMLWVIIIASIFGYVGSLLPWSLAVPLGILGGVVCMFLGMSMVYVRFHAETQELKDHLALTVKRAVLETRQEGISLALASTRSVADRVANRLLARHARGLQDAAFREAILDETDKLVDEEMEVFKDTLEEEMHGRQ